MFYVKQIQGKDVYCSDFLDNLEHFFTSRDLIVKENLDLISSYLNIKKDNLIHPNQTHTDNIQTAQENKKEYKDTDALILKDRNIAIYLNFADCTPVILYDSKQNIGAIAHAGWRGTAKKIAAKTVLKMQELYNSKPENIIAAIGPCISFQHFETSDEAIYMLSKTITDTKGLFKDNYADLKGINERQLREIGVEKIDICPYCTVENNDKFFSYRKENATKLRHSAIIKLKS